MKVTPYNSSQSKKQQVASMFNNIAHRYDFLNSFLSMGIHHSWRKKAVKMLKSLNPQSILDIATGTGDFAVESFRQLKPKRIVGIDISEGMLEVGRKKISKLGISNIDLQKGDSEAINFPDGSFDGITVGFGVRNFENLTKGLSEMNRVLRPGGKAIILEFAKPKVFPVKQIYSLYFLYWCPIAGKLFSRDNRAYSYLYESVQAFPDRHDFLKEMQASGFKDCKFTPVTFGIACIYTGVK